MSQVSAPIQESPSLRRRARKDVSVQVFARVANLALGVVVSALLARTLGSGDFGRWITLLTTFQLVGFFASLGLDSVAMREAARDPGETITWIGALLLTRLALTLPTMVVALIALLSLEDDPAMLTAGLVLLLQFPLSVGSSLQLVHQLNMRNWLPMVLLTLNSVIWAVCVLVINLRGGGLIALAVALMGTAALTISIQAAASLKILGLRLRSSRAAVTRLLRIGAPLGLAGLLVNVYARVDQIIVYGQAGSQAAGIYGSVYRVLEQAHFIPVSLLTTIAPLLASLWVSDRGRMLRIVGLSARLLAIGSFGAIAFATAAARPIMRLLFGEAFVSGAAALPVLGGAFVFICFGYLVGNLLFVTGQVRNQIAVGLVGLVVNVAGNLVFVPRYGYMGAAWMTLVTEAAVVAVGGWFVLRRLELDRVNLLPIGRIAVAAALLYLALDAAAGAGLVVMVSISCVVYPVLLLALRAVELDELRTELKKAPAPNGTD